MWLLSLGEWGGSLHWLVSLKRKYYVILLSDLWIADEENDQMTSDLFNLNGTQAEHKKLNYPFWTYSCIQSYTYLIVNLYLIISDFYLSFSEVDLLKSSLLY